MNQFGRKAAHIKKSPSSYQTSNLWVNLVRIEVSDVDFGTSFHLFLRKHGRNSNVLENVILSFTQTVYTNHVNKILNLKYWESNLAFVSEGKDEGLFRYYKTTCKVHVLGKCAGASPFIFPGANTNCVGAALLARSMCNRCIST